MRVRKYELEQQGLRVSLLDYHGDAECAARNLYRDLRAADADADVILAAGVPERGSGAAVMDRLRKAADGHVIAIPEESENRDRFE